MELASKAYLLVPAPVKERKPGVKLFLGNSNLSFLLKLQAKLSGQSERKGEWKVVLLVKSRIGS